MREKFSEFIDYDDNKKSELWKDSIYVFDTNILLNLYRYSRETSNYLLEVFGHLDKRLWLPSYVAFEFLKNRINIIYETNLDLST